LIGRTIGPYNIVEILGKGGMGVVYKAIHTTLEQQVAIKALSSELSSNPSSRKRFVKEAKIQAKFSHPNVVNIFNYLDEGEDVYIVMEYVNGQTLEQKLKSEGAISEKEAISISIPVLEALDFMHSNGVIHRDIKPSNIMITNTGLIKVTDFGIAKILDENTQHTKTGMVGSLYYISPEQILGEETSAATDVCAYGATLFHMITGTALFEGNEYTIMRGHLEGQPIPPWEVNINISKNFGTVVLKAIQKAPQDRYQTARAFSEELKKVDKGSSISITVPRILKNNQSIFNKGNFVNKWTIYSGIGLILLFLIITLAFNRESEDKISLPPNAFSTINDDSEKTQIEQTELPVLEDVKTSNTDEINGKSNQRSDRIDDESLTFFDDNLNNKGDTKKIEERNKKLEEKLREEQKRYEEKAREAKKKEEEELRRNQKKQKKVAKKRYKKVFNPIKNKVYRPLKRGFNKLKEKIY